jgi:hypothetical protein
MQQKIGTQILYIGLPKSWADSYILIYTQLGADEVSG